MNRSKRHSNRSLLRVLALAVPALLVAMALSTPAEAKHKHKHKHKHPHKVHHQKIIYAPKPAPAVVRAHQHPLRYRGFVAPRVIGRRLRADFRPYYVGRAYSPAHRHFHRVYSFPQRTRGGYIFQPHYYCEGRLILVDTDRPRGFVSFRLDF